MGDLSELEQTVAEHNRAQQSTDEATDAVNRAAADAYRSGHTLEQIGAVLGVTDEMVRRRLLAHGVKLRKRGRVSQQRSS